MFVIFAENVCVPLEFRIPVIFSVILELLVRSVMFHCPLLYVPVGRVIGSIMNPVGKFSSIVMFSASDGP